VSCHASATHAFCFQTGFEPKRNTRRCCVIVDQGPITCQQDTRQASMLSSKMMLVVTKEDKPVRDACQWHEVLSRWHGGVRAELNRRTKRMAVSAHDMAAIRQSSDPIRLTINIGAEIVILQAKAYHTRIQMHNDGFGRRVDVLKIHRFILQGRYVRLSTYRWWAQVPPWAPSSPQEITSMTKDQSMQPTRAYRSPLDIVPFEFSR
jgi:hypothetical protein